MRAMRVPVPGKSGGIPLNPLVNSLNHLDRRPQNHFQSCLQDRLP
jgi:hypothetical protein